jgi:hypothetical protein
MPNIGYVREISEDDPLTREYRSELASVLL